MIQKLQSMMHHVGERSKMSRGRQEDILRMLREFASDIDAGLVRAKERSERARKQAAKNEARKAGSAVPPAPPAPAAVEVGGAVDGGGAHAGAQE
ncbi:hypothetical protein BWQ96_04649 [Gracilariopsis chorda]|uniref:Uncharacterized protein n=1 Tax=Gracilariopsis chorda TaxID=448386 RepID=A0A2V3ITZ4_9FLOR|nr:hypothetical protein BWQ96_04649 [Gracilariopsis chorda]|eukprot:PXF45572.1 hypothetical protein BWQ96_04649 [Gracilariopsis chorda]